MFIDDIKFRYTYLNTMKNVVWEQSIERPVVEGMVVAIHPELEDVLDKLMRERPTWRFKSNQDFYGGSGGIRRANTFNIYDGDEALGRLWVEHHWRDGTPRFFFTNFRLEQQRQRHRANYTTKPDVAAKRIIKAFHLKTPSERAADANTAAKSAASKISSDASWPLRRAKGTLEKALYAYALQNWGAIKDQLGPDAAKVDLPAVSRAADDATEIQEAVSSHKGCNVQISPNGTYLVSRGEANGYHVATLHDGELEPNMRGSLGLLKLMEDGAFIPGIGVRINANHYFVMDIETTQ
jgi:hypothetical protein